MRIVCLLLAFFAVPLAAHAQYGEWIRTGRPGQAMGAYTIGKNTFQVQQGVSYRSIELGGDKTVTLSEANVLRVGLTEHFELSAVVGFAQRRTTLRPNGDALTLTDGGVNNTQIGFRYNILSATDKLPAVAIQTRLLLKAQSEPFRRANVGTTTIIGVGKPLGGGFGLIVNYGFTHSGNAPGIRSFYVIRPTYAVTQRLEVLADVFGDFNEFDLNIDFGVGYFISRDVKVDVSYAAQGFGDFAGDGPGVDADWSVGAGVSWRINWRGPAPGEE